MDQDELKHMRKIAKSSITRISNWVKANSDSLKDVFQFRGRLETLETSFVKYNDAQDKLECKFPDEGAREDRDLQENLYFDTPHYKAVF